MICLAPSEFRMIAYIVTGECSWQAQKNEEWTEWNPRPSLVKMLKSSSSQWLPLRMQIFKLEVTVSNLFA